MIISRPFASLRILPQKTPSSTEIGTEMMAARTIPGIPMICQSAVKISAISAAMAPSVIPKFSPIPAMIGMSRLRIRNAFLPMRVTISLISILADRPESGMQTAQIMMNMIGTDNLCARERKFVFFIWPPPSFWSVRTGSCPWKR